MDISSVVSPVLPEVQSTPPRDAQLETAVSEASQSESPKNDTQSESDSGSSARDESSNKGRNIDEHA